MTKLKITTGSEEFQETYDYQNFLKIEFANVKFEFLDGEPEDANLSRDFNDCYSIEDAIMKAYALGKANEPIKIERVEIDCLD